MKYLVLILALAAVLTLRAEDKSYTYQFTVTNNAGVTQDSILEFGVHPQASDTVDFHLGESDRPPIAPFDNVYGIFKIRTKLWSDMDTVDHWSYKDFRYYKPNRGDSIVYYFSVYNQDSKTTFTWQGFGNELDSAFVSDYYGESFRFDIKSSTQTTIDLIHFLVRDYRIVLYFNPLYFTPAEESGVLSGLSATYSARSETINWQSSEQMRSIAMFDVMGEKFYSARSSNTSGVIDASNIKSGVFFVEFVFGNGEKQVKKFIKY